jgi:hypothetical protein
LERRKGRVRIKDLISLLQDTGADDDTVVGYDHGGEIWAFKGEDGIVYVEERID